MPESRPMESPASHFQISAGRAAFGHLVYRVDALPCVCEKAARRCCGAALIDPCAGTCASIRIGLWRVFTRSETELIMRIVGRQALNVPVMSRCQKLVAFRCPRLTISAVCSFISLRRR